MSVFAGPHPICAALNPPQTSPASQSPLENKEEDDKSEYCSLAPLVSHLLQCFPPKSKKEDLVFTKGPRVGSCESKAEGRAKL